MRTGGKPASHLGKEDSDGGQTRKLRLGPNVPTANNRQSYAAGDR